MFKAIVLPKVLYGLSVYGASGADLRLIQRFLTRCFKRRFFSRKLDVSTLLAKQDYSIYNQSILNNNPLGLIIPKKKRTKYNLRKKGCYYPKLIQSASKICLLIG